MVFTGASTAWIGHFLEPGGDINAVTVDVLPLDDHIPEIDADAEQNVPIVSIAGICGCQSLLHLDLAGDGIDRTCELHQYAIAHELDDAAMMFGDRRLHNARKTLLQ